MVQVRSSKKHCQLFFKGNISKTTETSVLSLVFKEACLTLPSIRNALAGDPLQRLASPQHFALGTFETFNLHQSIVAKSDKHKTFCQLFHNQVATCWKILCLFKFATLPCKKHRSWSQWYEWTKIKRVMTELRITFFCNRGWPQWVLKFVGGVGAAEDGLRVLGTHLKGERRNKYIYIKSKNTH